MLHFTHCTWKISLLFCFCSFSEKIFIFLMFFSECRAGTPPSQMSMALYDKNDNSTSL